MPDDALMETLAIKPIKHSLDAEVRVPGSKSLTNRVLPIAVLAEGEVTIKNALRSDDSILCAEALKDLGFDLQSDPEQQTIRVAGQGGRIPAPKAELFIGNAGTAARFLTALVTLGRGEYVIDGNARMRERPIADLVSALRQLGADLDAPSGCPPVRIRARGLKGGRAVVAGNVSSQYLSGLLLAAPYAQGAVAIEVAGELGSKPYVDMTLALMEDFGVRVERDGYQAFRIEPQKYRSPHEYAVESDASAASYFFAAPAILGGSVLVLDLSRGSRQGDVGFLDVLAAMGCRVEDDPRGLRVAGPSTTLRGVDVDMRDIPDTAQTLAAVALFADSPTTIRGIASARVKETDRVAAMAAELRRLGVAVEEYSDGLKITPRGAIRPATIRTYDDHRMAMAFALVGLRCTGIVIENPGCVAKTFPRYFETLDSLR
jgi:3-phosphoshikimate 1-carboxyvinyltransferase